MTYNFITSINIKNIPETINVLFDNIKLIESVTNDYIHNIQSYKIIKIKDYDISKKTKIHDVTNIVLSLFRIIYNLIVDISVKKLESVKEYKHLNYDITYRIIVANDSDKQKLFALFILMYKIEPYLTNKKYYVGIDFEFHKGKDIRLMQLNFERKQSKKHNITSFIWIIKPPNLDNITYNIMIKYFITHDKIYKIMNGADALDTPYMISQLFKNDKSIINKFFFTFFDLRYICEFYKANWADDNKCDIYSSYLFFDVITSDKYELLANDGNQVLEYCRSLLWEKSNDDDDIWNIQKLDEAILYYVVFDVVYLKFLLLNIFKKSNTHPNFITNIKYIPLLTRYSLFEKHQLSNATETFKKIVDTINNYYFIKKNNTYKLIDTYKYFSESLIIDELNFDIPKLFKVNYFRNYLMYICKMIIYYIVCKKYEVFISKNNKYTDIYDIQLLFDKLSEIGFAKLNIFNRLLFDNVYKKIDNVSF